MNIPDQQSRRLFTLSLIKAYDENIEAPSFLSGSFFPMKTYNTLGVGWLARRGTERIAVDVIRGSKGNLNKATKFTEKMIVPPYYYERVSIESTAIYDIPFAAGDNYSSAQTVALAENTARTLDETGKTIKRAIELQAAQFLTTGIVELVNGDSVDFKRNPEMIEDYSTGAPDVWTTTGDVLGDFDRVGRKLRSIGKVIGGQNIVTIMGFEAFAIFRANEALKDGDNWFTVNNSNVSELMKNSAGGSYKGELKTGGYTFEIWVYDEVYEDENGDQQYYWDSKTVAWLPAKFTGETSFCAVPQLPSWVTSGTPRAKSVLSNRGNNSGFVLSDYVDEEEEVWYGRMKVCPIVQAKAIDQIYTGKVLA